MIGCLPRSFSSTAAFVLQPVLVFFPAGSMSWSNSTWPSCFGDWMLNGSPAQAQMLCCSCSMALVRLSPKSYSALRSTRKPMCSMRASTGHSGSSMSV